MTSETENCSAENAAMNPLTARCSQVSTISEPKQIERTDHLAAVDGPLLDGLAPHGQQPNPT